MIKSIHVENYKAFENATIPIKPFTVFLGENSAGKSSIIQLLLMLQQTAERKSGTYDSALLLNGDCTKRGTEKYLFHNFDVSSPLIIEIEIASNELLSYLKSCKLDYTYDFQVLSFFAPIHGLQAWRDKDFQTDLGFKKRVSEFLTIINKPISEVEEQKQRLKDVASFKDGYFSVLDLDNSDENELFPAFCFLLNLSKGLNENTFIFSFSLSFEKKNNDEMLCVNSFALKNDNRIVFSCDFTDGKLFSDFADVSKIENSCFQEKKGKSCTIFEIFRASNYLDLRTLGKTVSKVVDNSIGFLRREFSGSRISHVSPLRAEPLRYYELDNSNKSSLFSKSKIYLPSS